MKRCSSCKDFKDFKDFNKCKSGTFGLQGYCRGCSSDSNKKYQKVRAPRTDYNAIRYAELKDTEAYQQYQKSYREDNKDALKKQARDYRLKNKIELLVGRSNQKCRQKGIPGVLKINDWRKILDYIGYKCMACGETKQLSIDHVIPVSIYGLNIVYNIQCLCLRHNLQKGTKVVDFRTPEFNQFVYENCSG